MLRKIIPYGARVLREPADEVISVDEELKGLVVDMTETLKAAGGIGLAAPQVGVSKRLFIVDWSILEEGGKLEVFINPRILKASPEKEVGSEGCLSLPQLLLDIKRPKWVEVEYTRLDGEQVKMVLTDFPARVFQHEYDHLEGKLIIDYVDDKERMRIRKHLRDILEGRISPFDPEKPETYPQREEVGAK